MASAGWQRPAASNDHGSRLVRGTITTLVIFGGASLLRYGLNVFFARLGGVTQYGKYVYAMNLGQLVLIPAQLGLSHAVIKFVPMYLRTRDLPRLRGLLRRSLQVGVGLSATVAVVGCLLVLVFDPLPGQRTSLAAALALVPLLAWSGIWRESTRGAENVAVAYGAAELPPPIVAAAVVVGLRSVFHHVTGAQMIEATVVAYLFTIGLQRVGIRRVLAGAYRSESIEYDTRLWLSVSLPLMTYAGLQVVMNNSDLVVVGLVRGSKAAGYYGAANKTAFLVSFVMLATTGIAAPMIARAFAAGDEPELRRLARKSFQGAALPTLAVVALVFAFAPRIMATFGSGFAGGVFPLRVLAVGQLVNALTGPVDYLLMLTDGQGRLAKVTVTIATLQLGALVAFVPTFGARGAAVVSTVAVVLWQGWLYVSVRRRFGIRLVGRTA